MIEIFFPPQKGVGGMNLHIFKKCVHVCVYTIYQQNYWVSGQGWCMCESEAISSFPRKPQSMNRNHWSVRNQHNTKIIQMRTIWNWMEWNVYIWTHVEAISVLIILHSRIFNNYSNPFSISFLASCKIYSYMLF